MYWMFRSHIFLYLPRKLFILVFICQFIRNKLQINRIGGTRDLGNVYCDPWNLLENNFSSNPLTLWDELIDDTRGNNILRMTIFLVYQNSLWDKSWDRIIWSQVSVTHLWRLMAGLDQVDVFHRGDKTLRTKLECDWQGLLLCWLPD